MNHSETLMKSNRLMMVLIGLSSVATFTGLGNSIIMPVIYGILLVGMIAIVFIDHQMWADIGITMPNRWWALAFPVYLWKRANILQISKQFFWIWLVLWSVCTLIVIKCNIDAPLPVAG